MKVLRKRTGKEPDTAGTEPGGPAGSVRKKGHAGRAIIGAFAAALFVKCFILDFMITEGQSMTPAVKPGTILPVCKIFYGVRIPGSGAYLLHWRVPRRGEVVVFYTPLGEIAVKRCGETFPGEFYALGDNDSQSYDSRSYGPVPNDNIIGRVLGIGKPAASGEVSGL